MGGRVNDFVKVYEITSVLSFCTGTAFTVDFFIGLSF
jgi:hypothetical protein